VQHHAQDAVDAEPGVPEAGVGHPPVRSASQSRTPVIAAMTTVNTSNQNFGHQILLPTFSAARLCLTVAFINRRVISIANTP
jgi:hypothetical protein